MTHRPEIRGFAIAVALVAGAAGASAQGATANTISCGGFFQLERGMWYAKAENPQFDLGSKQDAVIKGRVIQPGRVNVGGYDLAEALDAKCRDPK